MKTKLCGIYSIYCASNGKRYIGLSLDIEKRWSYHKSKLLSGKHFNCHMQASWNKYGPESFEFMVMRIVHPILLEQFEIAFISEYDTANPDHGFNMNRGGDRPVFSEETRAKIGAAAKGRKHTPEARAKISAAQFGRKQGSPSAEVRAKMSIAHKGRVLSQETRAKMSAVGKARTNSAETRAKLSASGMGHICSDETRAKISASRKGQMISDETRAKMSASQRTRNAQRREY